MLLGFPAITHTDHKNVLYTSFQDKRWKLLLEIYRLSVKLGCGFQNIGANAFPRLRYEYVKQETEQETFVVGEEVAIDVLTSLRNDLVELNHEYLLHPGGEKQYRSMATFGDLRNGTVENKIMDTFCLHQCQMTIGVVHADLGEPLEGDYYCLTVNERQFCWIEVMMQRGRTAGTTALSLRDVGCAVTLAPNS
ncbi:LOW QUALITY PROTEIN: hypothetical protein PHPALM_27833 [Phytophthora palmivora]|uniref:Reverse transcriptase RNase H-like domain-containing protein n=1 Tax=Phytophthora palmivora TaxID=4796 RepID=A0A2P4XBM4_9STRA|nr:LOW QUALITY PROTEIN: hypothetical protein PHPALM_27833 [Phytophthora palmivora]